MNKSESTIMKWSVTIIYIIMLCTNAAAVLLPLNGMTTQEVSDSYPNLFAPAGLTFAIWSVIYLLLAGFVIYQWRKPSSRSILSDQKLSGKLRTWFIISSILNSVWLVAWQYLHINLSVIIMLGLLAVLIYVNLLLEKAALSNPDYIFIRLPFSIYFGWITIATIANITAFLVDKQIGLFQNNQVLWTIIILIIGMLIISTTIIRNRDVAYGLATLWAYYGILLKHQAADGWNNEYPMIITTVIICLVIIAIVCVYEFYFQLKNKKKVL
ncbi:tryptophan-rich sensory protein [Candidatus Enterococcus ikei]|uniref:Tryptophan-rich sensory protein n=1 Tax=Candidatus Enterococcus ikei TaxID=2815326 RepID=A0ABS3H3V4_9ENTE|nr:tryptophan-rich sensory protein [Enterococcus sp. DIV0869a]MBO0441833.1 tryptophan-rich sensory protein [Enterococcus sp. DIV0869a]